MPFDFSKFQSIKSGTATQDRPVFDLNKFQQVKTAPKREPEKPVLKSPFKFGLEETLREFPLTAPWMPPREETPRQKLHRLSVEAEKAKMKAHPAHVAMETGKEITEWPMRQVGKGLRWLTTPVRAGIKKAPFIPEKYREPAAETVGFITEMLAFAALAKGIGKGVAKVEAKRPWYTYKAVSPKGQYKFQRAKMVNKIKNTTGVSQARAEKLADVITRGRYGKDLIKQVERVDAPTAEKIMDTYIKKVGTQIKMLKTTPLRKPHVEEMPGARRVRAVPTAPEHVSKTIAEALKKIKPPRDISPEEIPPAEIPSETAEMEWGENEGIKYLELAEKVTALEKIKKTVGKKEREKIDTQISTLSTQQGELEEKFIVRMRTPAPTEPPKAPVTDAAQIQEIKNSIAEGEMILKSGKTTTGRKMSAGELDAVRRSVENAKAKIELPTKAPEVKPATYTVWQGRGARKEDIYEEQFVELGPTLGKADYYAFKKDDAIIYGEDIKKHKVTLENPLQITTDDEWVALTQKAGLKYPKFWDTTNIAAVKADKGKLVRYIKSQGYDGVVIKLDETKEVSTIAAFFDHNQIIKFKPTKAPEVEKAKRIKKIIERTPEGEQITRRMRGEITEGEAGYRAPKVDEYGETTDEWMGVPSTFPEYFKNKGYTKKQTLDIMNKVLEGKPLTEKQETIYNDLREGAERAQEKEEAFYESQERTERELAEQEGIEREAIEKATRAGEAQAQGDLDEKVPDWVAEKEKPPPKVPPKKPTDEAGFVAIPSGEEFIKGIARLTSIVDIEKPFVDIGAKETGFAVKNFYTRRTVEREKGKIVISKLSNLKLAPKDYTDATYAAAQPDLLKHYAPEDLARIGPASQMAREYFDSHIKRLQELKVIADPWPKSLIKRLQSENLHYEEAIKTAKNKPAMQEKIDANNFMADFLKRHDIQYVHLPLRVWLEDLFRESPDKAPKILSRFFKARKTVDLKALAETLIDEGIIKPEDVDIRNIIASYSNKVGRTYALSEIFQSAMKEGLVKSLEDAPTDWVSPPSRLVPEFRGTRVHPAFMTYLEKFLNTVSPAYRISRVLGYIKIMAFDNPFFLLGYNIEQGFWAGSFRTIKAPVHIAKAIKSIWKKDDHYWNAFEDGLFSKPYIPPFEDFQKEIDLLKETSLTKRAFRWMKQALYPMPFDAIYKPLWNIAWNFSDRYPRMATYHYFLAKGMSSRGAAQLGTYFHGDYASVPPGTRKVLNKIFFTPTFKIIMSKLQLSMMKSAGKVIWNAARLKKSSKRDQMLAAGLLALLALEYARRKMMKHFGFKEQDFGLRYVKEVDTPQGKRELVVYMPTAGNTWLRYYHRWKAFPEDPEKLEGFIARAKWDLHPLWRVSIMNLQNRRADGEPIYNPFDDKIDLIEDFFKFNLREIVSVLDRLPDPDADLDKQKQAYDALRHDLKQMYPLFEVLSPSKLTYLRKPEAVRQQYRAGALYNEFRKFIFMDPPKNVHIRRRRIENFKERLNHILKR